MKAIFFFITFFFCVNAFSQKATVKGSFDNPDVKRRLVLSRPMNITRFANEKDKEDILLDKGIFNIALVLEGPEIMYLTSYVNDSVEFKQPLFLKAGYEIILLCKNKNGKTLFAVTGKDAQDNQPWKLNDNIDFAQYQKDTVPDRIITDLEFLSGKNQEILQQYIATYKPSADFIKAWTTELQYTTIRTYYIYSKQRKFNVRAAYNRNKKSWDDVLERLLAQAPLMNETALSASSYRVFLKLFLIFSKPHITDGEQERKEFIKQWYVDGSDTGTRSFLNDDNNVPTQKIIEYFFAGKVKEYQYANLFKMALENGTVNNIGAIYTDFIRQYPVSRYRKVYDKPIKEITGNLKKWENVKMIFESSDINTWAEVLNLFKGKTVLLDMWGTWCGPCREEIKNNVPVIKNYFKDKGLEYLYIANKDTGNEKIWKSLITYFDMEGHHILAKENLTNDIGAQIALKGYPTYVIIHKDGSFESLETGGLTEANMKILIAKIENDLK